jgi:subtilisin
MPESSKSPFSEAQRPHPTGNVLVIFKPKTAPEDAVKTLRDKGIPVDTQDDVAAPAAHAAQPEVRDQGGAIVAPPPSAHLISRSRGRAFFFRQLNVAVIPGSQAKNGVSALALTMAQDDTVLVARPEFYMFAIGNSRYDNWVQEGLRILIEGSASAAPAQLRTLESPLAAQSLVDTSDSTWGVKAVAADKSQFTGRGVKLAVIDTGFDLGFTVPPVAGEQFNASQRHPDFAGRNIVFRNFVNAPDGGDDLVSDRFGHGTHCLGTALGPTRGTTHPRYGIATEADIYVAKVLNDQGAGLEQDIVAGMAWAIHEAKCAVISMSLGRAVQPGESPDPTYEQLGQQALDQGSLIIAAAGNDSFRSSGYIAPVSAPANSSTIMAVAAVDANLQIAPFSNGGVNSGGGEVDIAGPGMSVFSSFPRPQTYKTLMGTSMAAPHVAGIAAQWAQSDPKLRGKALWQALTSSALELGLPQRDVGSGLVQAPVSPPPAIA